MVVNEKQLPTKPKALKPFFKNLYDLYCEVGW